MPVYKSGKNEIFFYMCYCNYGVSTIISKTELESWLDERGHSLVPLSNPGSDPEVSLGSGGHRTPLGRQSDELRRLEQGDCHIAISFHTVTSFLPRCRFLPQHCFHIEMQLCTNHKLQ